MQANAARTALTLGLFVTALSVALPTSAGVAELSLDRAAVHDLLIAATPTTLEVETAGLGRIVVELGRPRDTDFVDGGIHTALGLRVPGSDREFELSLRYVPEFDPLYGTPRLVIDSATLANLDLDLAPLLPAVTLPRSGEWSLAVDAAAPERKLKLTYYVQGLVVEDERLRLDLGLRVARTASRQTRRRPLPPPASTDAGD